MTEYRARLTVKQIAVLGYLITTAVMCFLIGYNVAIDQENKYQRYATCYEDKPCWDAATMGNGVQYGDFVAPETCGDNAAICMVGHAECNVDCWHTRAPEDAGEIKGVSVTGWASERAYNLDNRKGK